MTLSTQVAKRQAIEKKIARRLIREALKAGLFISVHNGEELVIKRSRSVTAILDVMFSVDEEKLFFYSSLTSLRIGIVFLVYGNDGWDVINDYSVNATLDPIMAEVGKLQDRIADLM